MDFWHQDRSRIESASRLHTFAWAALESCIPTGCLPELHHWYTISPQARHIPLNINILACHPSNPFLGTIFKSIAFFGYGARRSLDRLDRVLSDARQHAGMHVEQIALQGQPARGDRFGDPWECHEIGEG